ncbi:MAG TPA: hypothetical protein VLA36_15530 [Longimicrobiales bacterium]|nr:hypothetical protein [Longimicrobiales bacterium]
MKRILLLVAVLPTLALCGSLSAQDARGEWDALRARSIGPAGMSGRVAAVDVVLRDRNIVYVGGATGGLFKSSDGGLTWDPVFDGQPALGIGAISVFQANPDIVWVGTGEGNPRNSAGVGRGLFRSMDAGRTWTPMGLERSERIARIVTHPTDPDVVYVGVMGPAWSDGQERGVYRTTDGGRNWTRVLWRNERTGAADLIMDPSNPEKLFAAMWEFRREPWFFTSGGPGSGLFVTRDGGEHWEELGPDDGLPEGELGRIGLAASASSPNVVYALVEATRSALLRSEDGGVSWRTINDEPGIANRPFYYADLRVDPQNENRLYSLHSAIQVSEDQGRTWETVVSSGIIHGDVHELWIDPDDSRRMILGEDGGIAFTYDRGKHWRFVENLTLAQFYHATVDNEVPFNVYGGLQDNGSWYGPSTVWENKGILNAHWRRVGGGDGFSVLDDPSSPRHGYSMSQQGSLTRFDKVTGLQVGIQPVHPDGVPLRFNWNAALVLDPHDSTTLYLGSQFVHRTPDHGQSWEIISPDLTTNDPAKQRQMQSGGLTLDATGAENHTTIIAIAPSPVDEGTIWAGTDDGNVQISRGAGGTWTNVARNLRGVPSATWVSDIEASHHDAGTAYVTFDDHRRGNWETYLYRTRDFGERWERIQTRGVEGFAHVLAEDPVEPNLLFLGTEFGLYVSLDAGSNWRAFTSGIPAVPVRDATVHPRDGDLVVATHGRGIFIIDDIRPLRALASGTMVQEGGPFLVPPPPAFAVDIAEGLGYRSTGHAMQQAETRPYGALVTFWDEDGGSGRLEVRDEEGALVFSRSLQARAGLNRVTWNLRPGGEADPARYPSLATVRPGWYDVSVHVSGSSDVTRLEVLGDPRRPVSLADFSARDEALREAARMTGAVRDAEASLRDALAAVDGVLGTLRLDADALRAQGTTLKGILEDAIRLLVTGPECQGICGGDSPARRVRSLGSSLSELQGAPGPNDRLKMAQARADADGMVGAVQALMSGEVAAYREALRAAGYTPFGLPEDLERDR